MDPRIFLFVVGLFAAHGYLTHDPDKGVGITPWARSVADRESDERIRKERVAPLLCPKWAARPLWQRIAMHSDSWCNDWLEARR